MNTLLTILISVVLALLASFFTVMLITIIALGFQAVRAKIREHQCNADPKNSCLSGDGLDHEADVTGRIP